MVAPTLKISISVDDWSKNSALFYAAVGFIFYFLVFALLIATSLSHSPYAPLCPEETAVPVSTDRLTHTTGE